MPNEYKTQYYCMVYFDILGHKEDFKKINCLPNNQTEYLQFSKNIDESIGRVLRTRKYFKCFFNDAPAYKPIVDNWPAELLDEFQTSQKNLI